MAKIKTRSNIGYSKLISIIWEMRLSIKDFSENFHHFINGKYCISISRAPKKVKILFLLKDKNIYHASKNCHELGSGKEIYIGESKRNMATRWGELSNV